MVGESDMRDVICHWWQEYALHSKPLTVLHQRAKNSPPNSSHNLFLFFTTQSFIVGSFLSPWEQSMLERGHTTWHRGNRRWPIQNVRLGPSAKQETTGSDSTFQDPLWYPWRYVWCNANWASVQGLLRGQTFWDLAPWAYCFDRRWYVSFAAHMQLFGVYLVIT